MNCDGVPDVLPQTRAPLLRSVCSELCFSASHVSPAALQCMMHRRLARSTSFLVQPQVILRQLRWWECISPAPPMSHAESAPVAERVRPTPAPVVDYTSLTPTVSHASPAPAVYAAPAPVVENSGPPPAVSHATPAPVRCGPTVQHAAPVQKPASTTTVCPFRNVPSIPAVRFRLLRTHEDRDWSRLQQGRQTRCCATTAVWF